MASTTQKDGNVITFYSYKGGTGRTMALSNVAVLLAQSGKKVLMIDWDLEAPGLTKYFKPYLPKGFDDLPGVIDFFELADQSLPKIPFDSDAESQMDTFFKNTSTFTQPLKAPGTGSNLFIMNAGRDKQEQYADQVGEFDWFQFFKKIPSFFTKWLLHYKEEVSDLFRNLYDLPEISMEHYANRIQIRHASSFAYEEKLAVVVEEKTQDRNSLSVVYRDFVNLLIGEAPVWMFGANGKHAPLKVFISYEDSDTNFEHELRRHLSLMEKAGKISLIGLPGDAMTAMIQQADIILPLISVDALASDNFWEMQLAAAMARHKNGSALVVPVILRACAWEETSLSALRVTPKDGLPVNNWRNRDDAYKDIASTLSGIVEERNQTHIN